VSIGQTLESAAMRAAIHERDDARGIGIGATIVIPCFNQAEYLTESLGSALAQTVAPLEIIVVDDGSTEDVGAAVAAIDPGGITVRCLRVANRGLPGARNTALMNARGSAFLPLDADDWLEPTFLERTMPLLLGHDVVCVGLQEHGERGGTYMPGCELGLDGLTLEAERASNRLFYCALFRTALLRAVGGYNGRMIHGYEDWDLWIDLMQRGARITAVNEVLFHYRTRADGMLADTEAHHREWNLIEMGRHHGYSPPAKTRAERHALARTARRQARRR
jgi:glycosyltransferase involved in cell wall biosynthesis